MWILIVIAVHSAGSTEMRYAMPDLDTCQTIRSGMAMTKVGTGQIVAFCIPEFVKR